MSRRLASDARHGDLDALAAWLRTALREGDRAVAGEALELLLARWRVTPWPALAEAIAALSEALESEAARALRETRKKSVAQHAWLAVDDGAEVADRGALLATLHRGRLPEIAERMQRVRGWPRDPRLASTVCGWVLELPFRSTSSKPTWGVAFDLLERCADPRSVPRLDPVRQPGWTWPAGDSMTAWLVKKVPAVLDALDACAPPEAPAAQETAALAAIAALARAGDAADLHLPAPETGDADAELDAALAAEPAPAVWQVVVRELEARAERGELDEALLDRVDAALSAWPDDLRVAPLDWWRGLGRKNKPQGHPALRVARALDLNDAPHNFSAAAAARLLSRPEITGCISHVGLSPAISSPQAARAVTSLPRLAGVESVTLTQDCIEVLASQPALFNHADRLRLSRLEGAGASLERLVSGGHLRHLRELSVYMVDADTLAALAASDWPHLERLELAIFYRDPSAPLAGLLRQLRAPALGRLALGKCGEDAGLVYEALAANAPPTLRELRVGDTAPALPGCIETLADRLEVMEIVDMGVDAALLTAVGRCARLHTLRTANLRISSETLHALFEPGQLTALRQLSLSDLSDAHIELVADAPALAGLTSLTLDWGQRRVTADGLRALDRAPFTLERLALRFNRLDDARLGVVLAGHHTPTLRELDLQHNDLGKAACEHLARAPLTALRRLDVSHNPINAGAAQALAGSETLRERLHRDDPWPEPDDWTLRAESCSLGLRGKAVLEAAFGTGVLT